MIDVQVEDSGLNINVSIEGSGPPGKAGEDGVSPTVDVTETENGHKVTITGKDGAKSFEIANGTDGADGTDGKSPYVGENGHWFEWQDGKYVDTGKVAEGRDGDDGVSPTIEVTQTGTGHKVVITDKDGEKSFDVNNGQNGEDGEDGVSPTIAVEDDEGGHKVIITGKDGPKEFVVLNGKDGDKGDAGQTPSITIGTVETLPADSPATAEIIGQTPNLTMNLGIPQGLKGDPGSSGGAGGELLLAEYVHQGNQEIHFTSFDWETGIGECTKPHGLTAATEVMLVPNNWWTQKAGAGVPTIPIEWLLYNNSIFVVPNGENQVKVTGSDKTTPISVDLDEVSNSKVDFAGFHLEIPIGFSISELPIEPISLRITAYGYIMTRRYRYLIFRIKQSSGKINNSVYTTDFLTLGSVGPSKCYQGVLFWYDICAELYKGNASGTIFKGSNVYAAQRKGHVTFVGDVKSEEYRKFSSGTNIEDGIAFCGIIVNSGYACYSNNTVFRLYARGVRKE